MHRIHTDGCITRTSHVDLKSSLEAPHGVPSSDPPLVTDWPLKPQTSTDTHQPHRHPLSVSHLGGGGGGEREREGGGGG